MDDKTPYKPTWQDYLTVTSGVYTQPNWTYVANVGASASYDFTFGSGTSVTLTTNEMLDERVVEARRKVQELVKVVKDLEDAVEQLEAENEELRTRLEAWRGA